MKQLIKLTILILTFTTALPWLSACSEGALATAEAGKPAAKPEAGTKQPADTIARVGDQVITFNAINTMINSSPIVGMSIPELGSPERDVVRITLLDKMISANLIYLDALDQGVDKDPEYQQTIESFRDAILANLYRSRYMVGTVEVTDQEIQDFYNNNIVEGTELSEELKAGIEATIRKERVKQRTKTMRERLREGHKSSIVVSDLDSADDQVRSDDDVMAKLDGVPITWGEVRPALQRAHTMKSTQLRIEAIEKAIDNRLMAQKAREVGLEENPVYLTRVGEFSKTRLINIHRGRLLDSLEPTEEELRAYYDANKDDIVVKEVRKVQMLVVESEEEADELKKKIESGQTTFHKAVADHSIVADAAKTLGQIGWVSEGSGFPELDKETFMLEPNEIGGPVKSPAGWHLVRVLDQRDAVYTDFSDEPTQNKTRRLYLDDKLDQYVIDLRTKKYSVEVDEVMINKLAQQEVDWYQDMLQKAQKSPEEVIEEIKRLQK